MDRQYETRMRIVRALAKMVKTANIEKVKVTELCRVADVGRQTFYDYFGNIFEVVNWYYGNNLFHTLYLLESGETLKDAHLSFFAFLSEERDLFVGAFKSQDYNSVYNFGNREIGQRYISIISDRLGRSLSEEEQAVALHFTAGAAWRTRIWASSGMRESPEFMAETCAMAAPRLFDCLQ